MGNRTALRAEVDSLTARLERELVDRAQRLAIENAFTTRSHLRIASLLALGLLIGCGGLTAPGEKLKGGATDGGHVGDGSFVADAEVDVQDSCSSVLNVSCCPGFDGCDAYYRWFCTNDMCEGCEPAPPVQGSGCFPDRVCLGQASEGCYVMVCQCSDSATWKCAEFNGCECVAVAPGAHCYTPGQVCTSGLASCEGESESSTWACQFP